MSAWMAPLNRSKPPQKNSGVLDKLREKLTITRTPKDKTASQLKLYHVVFSRGWDATNNQWLDVLWPELDEEFHAAHRGIPTWQLSWKDGSLIGGLKPKAIGAEIFSQCGNGL